MQLYYFETPNPRKPCAVAKYLEMPVEFIRVDLGSGDNKDPEFLAINPNGKVPTFVDGDTILWESHAIMCYLADKAGSDLWPKDDRQYQVLKWLNWDTAHFSRHAGILLFENFIKPKFGLGETNADVTEEASGFFHRFAKVLDDHLEGRETLVGPGLTVADFAVASFLPAAGEAKLAIQGYREINRWHDKLNELPAWREPFPAAAR